MKWTGILVLLAGAATLLGAGAVHAIEAFKTEFQNKYIKDTPTDDAEKKLKEAYETAKCDVCHTGKDKKVRNTYGKALAELLTKKDKLAVAKIKSALDTVAGQKSDPTMPNSPTFGDLIKEGKLPGK
jgi:hypothetical protein